MKAWASVVAFTIAALVPLVAQQQTAPAPLFRSAADIVEVDAVVHDKKSGQFVEDLTPEDFEVREEGHPEKIDLFYVVGAASAAGGAPTAGTPATGAAAPAAKGATPAPRIFVVVFDDDHLTPGGFKRVQAAALRLFSTEFHAGDIGGVLARGAIVNNRLTSNRAELLAAVKSAKPNSKSNSRVFDLREWPGMNDAEAFAIARKGLSNDDELLEVVRRACADDPDACKRVQIEPTVYEKAQRMTNDIRQTSDQTLRSLAGLMSGLARIQGRKTILLLSEGFVADESWPLVQQAVGLASRANARIYSIDARGLDKGREPSGSYAPHDDALGNLLASFDIGADSINSLAIDTGGFVVRNTNILDAAIGRIADEASRYYVLGYRPTAAPDGQFRKISVTVKRPGVSVRARSGYVATPRTLPATTAPREAVDSRAPAAAPGGSTPEDAGSDRAKPAAEPSTAAGADPMRREAEASSAAGFAATRSASASGAAALHIRPDASKHVEALANGAADTDAAAGWTAYQRGDVESARAALAAAAARPDARPWVQYALGQSEYALRDYASAIASWERVRASTPEFEPVYFDLVDGYIQTRDADKAIRVLHTARDRWPKDAEVHNALGVVQAARGALDDAVRAFSDAVAVAPHDAIGYFNLAKTLELRYRRHEQQARARRSPVSPADLEKAIANYKRYLEIGGPYAESAREGLGRLGWTQPISYFSFSRIPFAVAASGAFGAIATNFVRSAFAASVFPCCSSVRPR
jgi:VWFA-related protein